MRICEVGTTLAPYILGSWNNIGNTRRSRNKMEHD
jgi:hypothetical protein